MSICTKCKKKCEYRNVSFENMTLYCQTHCAYELKAECDKIATDEFRRVVQSLKDGDYTLAGVKGILKQAECILNVADNKLAGHTRIATAEEMTKKFLKDGWGPNTSFSELTLDEAKEKGLRFVIEGINKGRKFFRMNVCNNIYDDTGKLVSFDLKASGEHRYKIALHTDTGTLFYNEDCNIFGVRNGTVYASRRKAEEKMQYAVKYGTSLSGKVEVVELS